MTSASISASRPVMPAKHHEFGTLHIDLAKRRTGNRSKQAVEAAQRDTIDTSHAPGPDFFEKGSTPGCRHAPRAQHRRRDPQRHGM